MPLIFCACGCGKQREQFNSEGRERRFVLGHKNAKPLEIRLWAKVKIGDGCWLWTGRPSAAGYGVLSISRHSPVYAHRISYELAYGPIPSDKEIDHLCRNRACVNPTHLEAVSHRDNVLRGDSPMAINARKTHCGNGHPLTADNLYLEPSHRTGHNRGRCRICMREQGAMSRARRRVVRAEREHHPAQGVPDVQGCQTEMSLWR